MFKSTYYESVKINWSNPPHIKFMSADTETRLYYNNNLLTEEQAEELMKVNGQTWCKEHIVVKCWAFMLANDKYFLIFDNIEDFMTAVALLRVDLIVWYNAKFDFAIFDYYLLTHNWLSSDTVIKGKKCYGKLPACTYQTLNGDMGQRYTMNLWLGYCNHSYEDKVHKVKMIDLFNVLGGGLKRLLEDWNVCDNQGHAIRKLEMNYVTGDIADSIDYLKNDTVGLYFLTCKFSNEFKSLTGLDYLKGDYMTCGGLAKKVMLMSMYGCDYKLALKCFHEDYPLTREQDKLYRDKKLYRGGKTLVNERFQGKIIHNVYKFDVNSMYPAQMRTMFLPYGKPELKKEYVKDERIKIFHVLNMYGSLKPTMCAMWQDLNSNKYTDIINEEKDFYIFEEELNELENWYDLFYEYDYILYYEKTQNKGMQEFIDKYYSIKKNEKGTKRLVAKVILNSAYGKLGERVERVTGTYQLSEKGYVHYVTTGIDIDTKNMLNVVVGSYVTCLARVELMKKIRQITDNDPLHNFIYCDTDSIHAFTSNIITDPKELGMMKNESPDGTPYKDCIYLAPKSYLMLHADYKSHITKSDCPDYFVLHAKGVNTHMIFNLIKDKDFKDMLTVFRPNYPIRCLTGINAIGGKALIYKDKFILRSDFDLIFDGTQENGGILFEK